MGAPVLAELLLPAPIDTAWAHLREPALIRRWFGWEYDGLEHEIDVIFLQEAAVDDRAHTLEWGDGIQEGDRFALEDLGEETRLRVTRAAPAGGGGYDEIGEGWISFAQQLRFALGRSGGERQTLRLTRDGTLPPPPDGEEWFRTQHQTGVVVDGALVVAAQAPGRASAVVTAFGAAPDEAAWRAWWGDGG